MKKLIIDDYFIKEYLTCGCTKDNFIFENCPIDILDEAKIRLAEDCNGVQSCCVEFGTDEVDCIKEILGQFDSDYAKKLIGRDFVCCKIMQSLSNIDTDKEEYDCMTTILNSFLTKDIDIIRRFHSDCPMPYNITSRAKSIGDIELNIFVYGVFDKYTQQAINNFISSREPYSIKMFLIDKMSSIYDQLGNFIQSPHDYMTRDVGKYIELVDSDEYMPID